MDYKNKIENLIKKLSFIHLGTPSDVEGVYNGDTWEGNGPMDTSKYGSDINGTGIDIEEVSDELSHFWNESVLKIMKDFRNKIKDLSEGRIDLGDYGEVQIKADAANSFTETPYVMPDPNILGEFYEDARKDCIKEVLENSEKLSYTIGTDEEGLAKEINSLLARLLMPQYSRRVEVEDLNRNFWVISQNLSLLNNLLMNPDSMIWGDAIDGIIKELIGLWENIYRIWQAILFLAEKTDYLENSLNQMGAMAAKTKIKLAYSWTWGNPTMAFSDSSVIDRLYKVHPDNVDDRGTLELTETFNFKAGDSAFYGILPLIEKENFTYGENKDGVLYYLPFNKTITEEKIKLYSDEELDERFILGLADGPRGEIIGIERKFGNKPAREILQSVKSKNFVLVSPNPVGHIPVLDSLKIVKDPILNTLQFYRDFIVSADRFDGKPFGTLIENTFTWLRGGYLQYLQFSNENFYKPAQHISQSIRDSLAYIADKGIRNVLISLITDEVETYDDLKNALLNSDYDLAKLINDFYTYYLSIVLYFQQLFPENNLNVVDAPYFADNGDYTINTENPEVFCSKFVSEVRKYNSINSSDGVDTYVSIPTAYLFVGNEELFNLDGPQFLKIGDKKFKLQTTNQTPFAEQNRVIDWDLLSNMIFEDNFYNGELVSQNERNFTWEFDSQLINAEAAKANAEEVVPKGCMLGGWWKKDQSGILGNSYINPRENTFGIWFDFISDPTKSKLKFLEGRIRSLTLNESGNSWVLKQDYRLLLQGPVWTAHHYYNTDLSVPFSDVEDTPYYNFVRLGKPYPSIIKIAQSRENNENHLEALNEEDNYISYAAPIDNTNKGYVIDGFYGFENLNNYPDGDKPTLQPSDYRCEVSVGGTTCEAKVYRQHEDAENSFYGNPYIYNVKYEISSTDLINAYYSDRGDIKEGYSQINNLNEVRDPVLNISYLSGETAPQQLEISISKDTTQESWYREL